LSAGTEVVVVVSEKLRSHGCGERRGQQYGRRLAEARKKPSERADLSYLQKARNFALNQPRETWRRSQKADENDEEDKEPKVIKMMKTTTKKKRGAKDEREMRCSITCCRLRLHFPNQIGDFDP
jgi:chromatin segregation and condensation protein Rec8/ScpA/Scc1 (kleisin family)